MKKANLLRSLEDLTAKWVALHHPDQFDPHIPAYLEAFGPVIVDSLIAQEVARQNAIMVKPILIRYADTVSGRIPVTFRVRGYLVTKIRHNHAIDHHGLQRHWVEVAADYGGWYTLSDAEMVRLYEKFLEGGYLDSLF